MSVVLHTVCTFLSIILFNYYKLTKVIYYICKLILRAINSRDAVVTYLYYTTIKYVQLLSGTVVGLDGGVALHTKMTA